MSLKLITAPAAEPITVDEAKAFLRLTTTEEDDLIAILIKSARLQAEKITRRQLITATWEQRLDKFPFDDRMNYEDMSNRSSCERSAIKLIPCPVQATDLTVKYLDWSGVEKTLVLNTDYILDLEDEPARVIPAFGQVWPPTYPVFNAIRVQFKAGYGIAATSIPEDILNWLRVMISTLYENRELVVVNNTTVNMVALPFIDGLLDAYRVYDF